MSATIDQQFVEYIVKSLVSNPDDVKIERRIDEKGVLLELTVNPEDLGRVIGKRGAAAQALRTLLRALGTKNDARYNLKIVDNGEGPVRREERSETTEEYSSSESTDDAVTEETPAEEPVEAVAEVEEEEPESDMVSKARKELADLDDLDV